MPGGVIADFLMHVNPGHHGHGYHLGDPVSLAFAGAGMGNAVLAQVTPAGGWAGVASLVVGVFGVWLRQRHVERMAERRDHDALIAAGSKVTILEVLGQQRQKEITELTVALQETRATVRSMQEAHPPAKGVRRLSDSAIDRAQVNATEQ